MDIRRFFCENHVDDSIIEINEEEAYHLKKVLRVKIGNEIEITNGKGMLYTGNIDGFTSDRVRVRVRKTEKININSKKIVLAPSLLKRIPMNFMIEKLSEIGVNEITPVVFKRTECKFSDKIIQKWKKIAISSLKVNKQVWLTKINYPVSLGELIVKYKDIENKLMLDIDGTSKLNMPDETNTIAVIGPPGDYLEAEREELIDSGFSQIKINSSILKVETAAISISALLREKSLDPGTI